MGSANNSPPPFRLSVLSLLALPPPPPPPPPPLPSLSARSKLLFLFPFPSSFHFRQEGRKEKHMLPPAKKLLIRCCFSFLLPPLISRISSFENAEKGRTFQSPPPPPTLSYGTVRIFETGGGKDSPPSFAYFNSSLQLAKPSRYCNAWKIMCFPPFFRACVCM